MEERRGPSVDMGSAALGLISILSNLAHVYTDPETPAEGSEPFFYMYQNMAKSEDEEMAKLWLSNTEGLLLFVGTSVLFFHIASNIKSIL